MRSPTRKRKAPRRKFGPPPQGVDLSRLSARARYRGSPEHKKGLSFAGHPRPRGDATPCDNALNWKQGTVTSWLRAAIRNGHFSEYWPKGHFPQYVWHRDGDTVYEGRLMNGGTGEYKGYPLLRNEWPEEWQ